MIESRGASYLNQVMGQASARFNAPIVSGPLTQSDSSDLGQMDAALSLSETPEVASSKALNGIVDEMDKTLNDYHYQQLDLVPVAVSRMVSELETASGNDAAFEKKITNIMENDLMPMNYRGQVVRELMVQHPVAFVKLMKLAGTNKNKHATMLYALGRHAIAQNKSSMNVLSSIRDGRYYDKDKERSTFKNL